jgi:hypothetical protein
MAVKRLIAFTGLVLISLSCIGTAYMQLVGSPFVIPASQVINQPGTEVSAAPKETESSPQNSTATPLQTLAPTPTRTLLPTSTVVPSPTPLPPDLIALPANYGPNYFPPNINPLSGLVVDPALLERRPLAIKITNFPRRVRPQSGISLADIVYEYYIEGGLTRFIAIFYGKDAEQVGPIRSGRFFDEHIVRMYNAIFAFASADKRVLETWLESDLVSRLVIPRSCPPMCRDKANPDYNNLYTDTSLLGAYALGQGTDNDRYDLSGMRFQSIIPWGGDLGMDIYVRYSRFDYNNWKYDAGSGSYVRYQETRDDPDGNSENYEPMFDRLTGQPVATSNVVLIMVPHEEYLKSGDTEIFQLNLTGFGPAYIFRDGRSYKGTWARVAEDKPLALLRAERGGGAFPLKPGSTFIQVIGYTSDADQDGGIWRFQHHFP